MNNTLPPLSTLLICTGAWASLDDDRFKASFVEGYATDFVVPASYLADAHPDFPIALREAILNKQKQNETTGVISGRMAMQTFRVLTNDVFRFEDGSYQHIYTAIRKLAVDGSLVNVHGTKLAIDTFTHSGKVIQFVVSSAPRTTALLKSRVDAAYPGWQERFKIGTELGVDFEALMKHVFSVQTAQYALPPGFVLE